MPEQTSVETASKQPLYLREENFADALEAYIGKVKELGGRVNVYSQKVGDGRVAFIFGSEWGCMWLEEGMNLVFYPRRPTTDRKAEAICGALREYSI